MQSLRDEVPSSGSGRSVAGASSASDCVSAQTINSIETGRFVPSLPLALWLARFFDTAVEEMFHAIDD